MSDCLEKMKKCCIQYRRRRKSGFIMLCMAALSILAGICLHKNQPFVIVVLVIAYILTLVGAIAVSDRTYLEEYEQLAKEEFVEKAAEGLFEEFHYEMFRGIPEEEYVRRGLTKYGLDYDSEDLCFGRCNDMRFRMSDVCVKGTKGTTYFKGQWLEFDIDGMDCDLTVIPTGFSGDALKRNTFFTDKSERRYRIKTGNAEFDAEFTCLSHNDRDVFKVLTPVMMKRLQQLSKTYDDQFILAFDGISIYVLLHNDSSMLDFPLMENPNPNAILEKFRNDLLIVPKLVDSLGFNDVLEMYNIAVYDKGRTLGG